MHDIPGLLSDARLRVELDRCLDCEDQPCRMACPAGCSPADFIRAARPAANSDFRRSAGLILAANPLGGVCGAVCPDSFCVRACARGALDAPLAIPAVQAAIVAKAGKVGLPRFRPGAPNGKAVAVVGAGPAGLAAAAVLGQLGYAVTVFERESRPGGALNLIPRSRLSRRVLRADEAFVRSLGAIRFRYRAEVASPSTLLRSFAAVIVCTGLCGPKRLGIPGERGVVGWRELLEGRLALAGKRVAVIGGGAVAVDCATTATRGGARSVELIYRRKPAHMPLSARERRLLLDHGVEISTSVRPVAVLRSRGRVTGLRLVRLELPPGTAPSPENFRPRKGESPFQRRFDMVVSAIGNAPTAPATPGRGVFYAGDAVLGSATVVESVASGKNAAARADAFIRLGRMSAPPRRASSTLLLAGALPVPIPLDAEFFGRPILSPFLLSAAPHTDGYEQMRAAYARGWAGGVMKTAFDGVPVHVPGEYLFAFGRSSYGNCDNVSAHPLDRVCTEVERLVREFPDRLTLASTGGPLTGRDERDCAVWQSNTRKLEAAGAMGVEYSLSCPQGGDGSRGEMAAQDAELTARIVGWVMESGQADVPKLFKLTAAVTAIGPIVAAVRQTLARYPQKRAGITLANSFPALAFRPGADGQARGIVIGLSGEAVRPISALALARISRLGLVVSANGGAMDHWDGARFLALGARTVQFCSAVMKHGLGYVDDLHSGLSHLLAERGLRSVGELVGSALPEPIADFAGLSAVKKLPWADPSRCLRCGNCRRCPYQAVGAGRRGAPIFDPARCIGCSLCALLCPSGAIVLRSRTASPAEAG